MTTGTGLDNQIGIGVEGSYGVFATPTRFFEFESEALDVDKQVLRTRSIGDRFMRTGRTRHYIKAGNGTLSLPVMNKGMGIWLKYALGANVTAQVGSTAEYTHTAQPSTDGEMGDSLTVQKGLATVDGTVNPFNFLGGKITAWELVQELDANLMLNLTFDFMTVETSSALAADSYPALLVPLSFIDATLTVEGVEICVRSFRIGGTKAYDTERRCLGNTKKEPLANGEYEITGAILREFEDTAQYDAFISGATGTLVCTWAYGEIGATGNPFKLVVTAQEIEYTGETPKANGSEVVMHNLPFKALFDGTNPIVKSVYHTSDTAA